MKLFQYWDTGAPPEDVADCIQSVRDLNPEFDHQLFDRASAAFFIGKRVGQRERGAFMSLMVPAMQADYFRLCALLAKGGLYLDADTGCCAPLSGLLKAHSGEIVGLTGDGFMLTHLMVFRAPGNPFIRSFLDVATRNIEDRRFASAMIATGPYIGDAIHALIDPKWHAAALERMDDWGRAMRFGELLDVARVALSITPALTDAFRAITFLPGDREKPWLRFVRPAYKTTARHWTNWVGPAYQHL